MFGFNFWPLLDNAIEIANLHRRPEIAATSGTLLNKETLAAIRTLKQGNIAI